MIQFKNRTTYSQNFSEMQYLDCRNSDLSVSGDANPSLETVQFYCSMWLRLQFEGSTMLDI